jgi:hypothetical protein
VGKKKKDIAPDVIKEARQKKKKLHLAGGAWF